MSDSATPDDRFDSTLNISRRLVISTMLIPGSADPRGSERVTGVIVDVARISGPGLPMRLPWFCTPRVSAPGTAGPAGDRSTWRSARGRRPRLARPTSPKRSPAPGRREGDQFAAVQQAAAPSPTRRARSTSPTLAGWISGRRQSALASGPSASLPCPPTVRSCGGSQLIPNQRSTIFCRSRLWVTRIGDQRSCRSASRCIRSGSRLSRSATSSDAATMSLRSSCPRAAGSTSRGLAGLPATTPSGATPTVCSRP